MKKYSFLAALLSVSLLTGCGSRHDDSLPETAVGFETSKFVNENNKDDTYSVITYNDRQYIGYGGIKGRISNDEYTKCIGYLIQDGQEMKDVTFWQLKSVHNDDYIVWRDNGWMSQPIFFRAVDTKGSDVYTPDYIDSLDYEYWK